MANVKLSPALRWVFLLSALASTAALVFLPQDDDRGQLQLRPDVAVARVSAATKAVPATPLLDEAPTPVSEMHDPFAPRGWIAPPAPVAPAPAPTVTAPTPLPVTQEPPGPPALPYKFMGQLDDGGVKVMYLSHGNDTFVAHPGDTLEGAYKLLTMDARHIEFEHLPTGTKQVLVIPASQ